MPKDNALSFVGQIMTAYKAIMKAEGSALERAIECGRYLSLAKENVDEAKPKRKWSAWLKEHCPEIHQNTAALYMRLADPENADAIADCKSIREADVKLRQPRNGSSNTTSSWDEDETVTADDDVNSQRVVKTPASPDLADADTPRGRFDATERSIVVGAAPITKYEGAPNWAHDPVPTEPPLGLDNPALDPSDLEQSPAQATPNPAHAAPPPERARVGLSRTYRRY